MRFEWSESKRVTNLIKHGIDFLDAVCAFQDRMLVEVDGRFDYGETRHRGIGIVSGRVVVVVWTVRDGTVRFISARRANAKERTRDQTSTVYGRASGL